MDQWLTLTFILLAAAALMAALAAWMRLPTLLGYLAAGVLVGPTLLSIVQPSEAMRYLAELGVVLLMFMVGLEFSLACNSMSRRSCTRRVGCCCGSPLWFC